MVNLSFVCHLSQIELWQAKCHLALLEFDMQSYMEFTSKDFSMPIQWMTKKSLGGSAVNIVPVHFKSIQSAIHNNEHSCYVIFERNCGLSVYNVAVIRWILFCWSIYQHCVTVYIPELSLCNYYLKILCTYHYLLIYHNDCLIII